MHYVYILELTGSRPYVGSTGNLKQRLQEHKDGKSPATKKYLPMKLAGYICLRNRLDALRLEKYFKTGSGRAFRKKHFGI